MSGSYKWADIRADKVHTPEDEAAVAALVGSYAVIQHLTELRESRGLTQEEVARAWDVSQGHVSHTERRDDIYLSTLASYVAALGGDLRITAAFPDSGQVELDLPAVTSDRCAQVTTSTGRA